jgi:hypothetical protein
VVGVTRYIEFPSFAPERLFTFVYRPGAIEVSAVVGESSLSCSMPVVYEVVSTGKFELEEGEPFDAGRAWQRSVLLPLPSHECPPLLRSWELIRATAAKAGSCSNDTRDGIVYRHRVADKGFQVVSNWHNPESPKHAPQLALVEAYGTLLRRLSLYPE